MVVSVDRWSLYRGALVSLKWPMEQPTVVTTDKWSLYRGALVSLKWPVDHPTVVTTDRWSLYRGALVSLKWPVGHPTVVTTDRWSLYRGVLVSLKWPVGHPTVVTILFLYKWSSGQVSLDSHYARLPVTTVHVLTGPSTVVGRGILRRQTTFTVLPYKCICFRKIWQFKRFGGLKILTVEDKVKDGNLEQSGQKPCQPQATSIISCPYYLHEGGVWQ